MHNSTREQFFRSLMFVTTGILVISAGIFSSVFAKETSIASATRDRTMQLLSSRHGEDEKVFSIENKNEKEGYVTSTEMETTSSTQPFDKKTNKKFEKQKKETLKKYSQRLKQTDQKISALSKNWAFVKKYAPEDASDAIADGDAIFAKLKDARVQAVLALNAGDVQTAKSVIENDILAKIDDIRAVIQRIDALKRPKQYANSLFSIIKENQKTIEKLRVLHKDTTDVEDLLEELKEKQQELKALKYESDEFKKTIDDFATTNQVFSETVGATENIGDVPKEESDS